jgi:membrane peptidoglycan carboxypeptidase
MPGVPYLVHERQKRLYRDQNSPARRAGHLTAGCLAFVITIFALAGITLTIEYASLLAGLPNPGQIPALVEPHPGQPATPTRFYDRTGKQLLLSLENPAAANHTYLPVDPFQTRHLPQYLIEAMIVAIDPTFWNHPGFTFNDFSLNSKPTIAQNLVSDLLLWDEPDSLRRDLRERLLAVQITARYGRAKLIEWYLNSADFGNLAYGVDAAARVYFGKPADQLSLAESAALASVAAAPAINPAAAPQAVTEAKVRILKGMLDQGMIDSAEFRQASQEKLNFRPVNLPAPDLAPAFDRLVLEQLSQYINQDQLGRGGLQVRTTLDLNLQLQAECTALAQIDRLKGNLEGEALTRTGQPCQAARLLPTFPPGDIDPNAKPQANLAILDPATGQVLALVNTAESPAFSGRIPGHPPGSLLTPFIYLTAFSRGMSPASLVWDIPASIPEDQGTIENPDGQFHGPVRLRTALANDYLIPAAQILSQMGSDAVSRTASQLGISAFQNSSESLAQPFNADPVDVLEIAQAFSVFANQGVQAGQLTGSPEREGTQSSPVPATILEVLDDQGNVWLDCQTGISECAVTRKPLISPQLAYLVNDILSDEPARWPSLGHPNPLEVGRQAGAKIGQTPDSFDTWTVGYIPQLVAAVWMGNSPQDSPVSLPVDWSAGLWHAILQYASRELPALGWAEPQGISHVKVCDPSGLLPTKVCPNIVTETFLSGSEPVNSDSLHQVYQINRETGRLATVFTPPELVEEQAFLVFPPAAQSWAEAEGLRLPPEDYDVLETISEQDQNASITSPLLFSSVYGKAPVLGTASGLNFDFFRLQAGQGLNPTAWLLLGEDQHKPVKDGQLGVWDTTGLDGLYALQLVVVDQDKKVNTSTIQVTVDNQPPEVAIRSPEQGQDFAYPETKTITLQAEASDNLELERVEFYLDGQLTNTLNQPPFAVSWTTRPGEHRLVVKAVDRAGNTSQETVQFLVKR